jgi:hypothetical protein
VLELVAGEAGVSIEFPELQPSAVVLEDVDLVAEDRGYGPGPSPVLFTLLDAMDGAAADAQAVTRALLGVQDGSETRPVGAGRSSEGHRGVGWLKAGVAYSSLATFTPD